MARKTLKDYVTAGQSVAGVMFSGNFGSQDGDLRDYTFADSNVLKDTSVVDVKLTAGVYLGRDQFPVRVSNHLTDYAMA